jgi:hypothetical protein
MERGWSAMRGFYAMNEDIDDDFDDDEENEREWCD